jgi:hypothetical protein
MTAPSQNRMAAPTRRGRPRITDGAEPPAEIAKGDPCWCGAPHDALRVYGQAKAASGAIRWRYVRCSACGRKHTLRP